MKDLNVLFVGFAGLWLIVLGALAVTFRRQRSLIFEIDRLRQEIDKKESTGLQKQMADVFNKNITRVFNKLASLPGTRESMATLKKLRERSILGFCSESALTLLNKSLSENIHCHAGRLFGDIYVAVSTVPAVTLSEARKYFKGGYISLLNHLMVESDHSSGNVTLVHWVYCHDGGNVQAVHLTMQPPRARIQDETAEAVPIIADLLLTEDEKSRFRAAFGGAML